MGDGHFTNDPLETFGGAGVVEIPRIAVAASLHLREGFRTPRRSRISPVSAAPCMKPPRVILGWNMHWHRN